MRDYEDMSRSSTIRDIYSLMFVVIEFVQFDYDKFIIVS